MARHAINPDFCVHQRQDESDVRIRGGVRGRDGIISPGGAEEANARRS